MEETKKQKRAFLTGTTGMDGALLSEFLLNKGYKVYGLVRRGSTSSTERIDHLLDNPDFTLLDGDLQDQSSLIRAIEVANPDEVYHLAANSFVGSSWQQPLQAGEITGLGTARVLEAVRITKPDTKVYNAATSELYGINPNPPNTEETPFYPRSPYGVAKLYSYWMTCSYRESYGMFACSGILHNHEGPTRGHEFVTRKITMAVARIKYGLQDVLELGNMDAKRDWGHAKDYIKGMHLMLQQEKPNDYILATGETHSVREFVELAFKAAGLGKITWWGEGINEKGFLNGNRDHPVVAINPKFYRPAEVELLLGDPSKAEKELGWKREYSFQDLVEEMVKHDLELVSGS